MRFLFVLMILTGCTPLPEAVEETAVPPTPLPATTLPMETAVYPPISLTETNPFTQTTHGYTVQYPVGFYPVANAGIESDSNFATQPNAEDLIAMSHQDFWITIRVEDNPEEWSIDQWADWHLLPRGSEELIVDGAPARQGSGDLSESGNGHGGFAIATYFLHNKQSFIVMGLALTPDALTQFTPAYQQLLESFHFIPTSATDAPSSDKPTPPPAELLAHTWQLLAAGGEADDMFLPLPEEPAWLRFSDQPAPNSNVGFSFEGFSGCNALFGSYTVSEAILTMDVALTQKGCEPEDLLNFENYMLAVLRHQPTFTTMTENGIAYLTIQLPDDESGRLVFQGVETAITEPGCSGNFTPEDVGCLLANTDPAFVQMIDAETAVPPSSASGSSFCAEPPLSDLSQLTAPSDLMRVIFLNDDLWLWREETGTAVPLTSGGGVTNYQLAADNRTIAYIQNGDLFLRQADNPNPLQITENSSVDHFRFSPDGDLLAYSVAYDGDLYELWVIISENGANRLKQNASAADTWAQYPDAESVDFSFDWAADSHLLAYHFSPNLLGIGDTPPQPTFWLDGDSGKPLTSPPAAALPISYSGYQLNLVTTEDGTAEWHLVHQDSGRTDLILPTHPQATWTASPNGRYLIAATTDGAVIIDLTDLSQHPIPLTMQTIGVSHYTTVASSWWLDDTTWLAVIPENDDVFQAGATFGLWRVDAATGTAVPLGTYPGFALDVFLSPDQSRLAFWEETGNGVRNLHLVDVISGKDDIYDNGRYSLLFSHWLNDATQFIYSYQTRDNSQTCYLLGQEGHLPAAISVTHNANVHWVDSTRGIISSDNSSGENGRFGTLTFQPLYGEAAPVGSFLLPLSDIPTYVTYFEES